MRDYKNEWVDWVTARANCTLDSILEELRCGIQKDIETVNGLPEYRRHKNRVQFYETTTGFEVCWVPQATPNKMTEEKVIFQKEPKNNVILFWGYDEEAKIIRHEWDCETLSCILKINGKSYPLWQISQMALGDFFFNRLD